MIRLIINLQEIDLQLLETDANLYHNNISYLILKQ